MTEKISIHQWLRSNGYEEVADMISAQMKAWADAGIKSRRNWWEILSGMKDGKPKVVNGVEYPVLAVAQERQGKPVTSTALRRNPEEAAPDIWNIGRWAKKDDGEAATPVAAEETAVEGTAQNDAVENHAAQTVENSELQNP